MERRLAVAAMLAAVAGLAACGGGGGSPTAPAPVPTPPAKAEVTFNVDPAKIVAEYQGGGYYRFKVNLEFYDSAGVGFTINTVRTTMSDRLSGYIMLDYDYAIARHVEARGRTVLQFTSQVYRSLTGPDANVKFIANITDDKGNSMTLSNQATVSHVSDPQPEPGR